MSTLDPSLIDLDIDSTGQKCKNAKASAAIISQIDEAQTHFYLVHLIFKGENLNYEVSLKESLMLACI